MEEIVIHAVQIAVIALDQIIINAQFASFHEDYLTIFVINLALIHIF
jgi:hypothetical protein